jgi:antitoxin component HigA of HigAB toxin-antitoxin module
MCTQISETELDYELALERFEVIFDAEKGSLERDELDALGDLIIQYESKHF